MRFPWVDDLKKERKEKKSGEKNVSRVIGNRGMVIGNSRGDKRGCTCVTPRVYANNQSSNQREKSKIAARERERENFLTTYQTFHPFATNDSAEDIEREIDREREKERPLHPRARTDS